MHERNAIIPSQHTNTTSLFSARWRHLRTRRLQAEESTDRDSRAFEAREAEHLRRESEAFLARQMEDMQALQDEQRKAGMLLDDGAPVKLAVSLNLGAAVAAAGAKSNGDGEITGDAADGDASTKKKAKPAAKVVFSAEEDEEEAARKRKAPLVKLDFRAAENPEKQREQLEKVKSMVPRDKETLFKLKVRWDGVTDVSIPILLFLLPGREVV
jgi:RNA-binding protein 25